MEDVTDEVYQEAVPRLCSAKPPNLGFLFVESGSKVAALRQGPCHSEAADTSAQDNDARCSPHPYGF